MSDPISTQAWTRQPWLAQNLPAVKEVEAVLVLPEERLSAVAAAVTLAIP